MKTYHSKKETILKYLKELEIFLPRYQEIAYDIPVQKADVYRNSQELTTAISKRGDDCHKEIDAIIRRKYNRNQRNRNQMPGCPSQITDMISKITDCIFYLNIILDSNDCCLALNYNSEIFFPNSKSYVLVLLHRRSTKSNFLNSFGLCQQVLSQRKAETWQSIFELCPNLRTYLVLTKDIS